MPSQKLNVVFHGMFAFITWPDGIEVLAPNEEDHVYKAGAWGRERRLCEGCVYTLTGVVPHSNRPELNPSENLVVRNLRQINRDPEVLFCSMRLPFPESLEGLRRVQLHDDRPIFGGAAADQIVASSLPLVPVLTYAVDDLARVAFDPLPMWVAEPGANGIANLHVWAESDCFFTEDERDHPIRGFEQLIRLFPGLDLQLLYSTGAARDAEVPVPGMQDWEQATLRERSRLLYGIPQDPNGGRGAEVTNCLALNVDNSDDGGH